MGWTWEPGTPRERADMVRDALRHCGSIDQLRDLFHLTDEGCTKILGGEDWRPEYEAA